MYFKPMPSVTIEYQIGQINSKGEERPAEVIGGDIATTIDAINEARINNFNHPETHFALRDEADFDDREKSKLELELMDEFEAAWLPDVPVGNLQFAWIRHNPMVVDNQTNAVHYPFELNFTSAQIINGKQFYFYVHTVDKPLRSAFINWWHSSHPQFTHPDCSPRYFSEARTWSDAERNVYEHANSIVSNACKKSKINSVDDVILALQENGFEVVRHKSYLAVKDDSIERNIRLRGRIFAKDFDFSKPLEPRSLNEVLPLSPQEYRNILDSEIAKRKERLSHRYPHLYLNNNSHEKARNNKQSVVVIDEFKDSRTTGTRTRDIACDGAIKADERSIIGGGSSRSDSSEQESLQINDTSQNHEWIGEIPDQICGGCGNLRPAKNEGSSDRVLGTEFKSRVREIFARARNARNRDINRSESSGEDGRSFEENIGEFNSKIGGIFERYKGNAEDVVRTTATANSRTLAKIRILCNAVTKVAVALYHKLKGIPNRSQGGRDYDR